MVYWPTSDWVAITHTQESPTYHFFVEKKIELIWTIR